jgi:hypothetical protein
MSFVILKTDSTTTTTTTTNLRNKNADFNFNPMNFFADRNFGSL